MRKIKITDVDENGVEIVAPSEREQITHFPHGALRPAPGNRSTINPERLEELAASIAGVGLIHPLLVRPVSGGHEIVAGERRWRAWPRAIAIRAAHASERGAKPELPPLELVPCVVRVMTDEQAIQARCVENAQREDVTPLDEATAYKELVDLGRSQADVAELVGRTRAHVCERLSLLRLCPEAVELLLGDKLSVTHCTLLAALPGHDTQRKALAELVTSKDKPPPARAFQHALQARYFCRLSGATFSMRDVKPWPELGACLPCPSRAGNCREQYPGIHDDNICTRPECFHEKLKIATAQRLKQAADAGAKLLPPAALEGCVKGNRLTPDAPYVEMSSPVPGDPAGRTWATVVKQSAKAGVEPEKLAAVTPAGRVMMVADRGQAIKALAAVDAARRAAPPRAQADAPKEAAALPRSVDSVCREVATAAARRAADHGLSREVLQLVVEAMASSWLDTEGARSVVGELVRHRGGSLDAALGRLNEREYQSVICVMALEFAGGFEPGDDGGAPAIITRIAKALKMDVDEMLRGSA